jgi:hypothetical protein
VCERKKEKERAGFLNLNILNLFGAEKFFVMRDYPDMTTKMSLGIVKCPLQGEIVSGWKPLIWSNSE